MRNVIDYVKENLNTFEEQPFGEADSLVLSCLSYLHMISEADLVNSWAGLPLKELFRAEFFDGMFSKVNNKENASALLTACTASPRFRDIIVCGHSHILDDAAEIQFAAVTFRLNEELLYVAYRGTDGTFTGWQEDLNLGRNDPVPAQAAAAEYLQAAAAHFSGGLMTGGHSKGGNLAVYAAANAVPAVQSRIAAVWSHDGPGFRAEDLEEDGFRAIIPLIRKTIPQSSLVGMIFEPECECEIVYSNDSGLGQHNPYTWEIDGTEFRNMPGLNTYAKLLCRGLNEWCAELTEEERDLFTETVFELLRSSDAKDFEELGGSLQESIPAIVRKMRTLDKETVTALLRMLRDLAGAVGGNIPEVLQDRKKKPAPGTAENH